MDNNQIPDKIKKKSIVKQTNRGKPADLKQTRLNAPDIWTNKGECAQLIKFLADHGRHIYVHHAGKHSKNQDQIIEPFKEFYDKAEKVAKIIFSDKFISKRCLVYFFRKPDEEQLFSNSMLEQMMKNKQHALILIYVKDLISTAFINDLILILNSEKTPNELSMELLSKKQQTKEYSQIIKNAFIQHILTQMIETGSDHKFSQDEEKTEKVFQEQLAKEFYKFLELEETKIKLTTFIEQLLSLFQLQNDNVYEEDQSYNEDVYDDEKSRSYQDQDEYPDDYSGIIQLQSGTKRSSLN